MHAILINNNLKKKNRVQFLEKANKLGLNKGI